MSLSNPYDWPAVEHLEFTIPRDDVDRFFEADANVWTPYLSSIDGYGGKMQVFNTSTEENITVAYFIFWDSYEAWKEIPVDELISVQNEFVEVYGSDPTPEAVPTYAGWALYQNNINLTVSPMGCDLKGPAIDNMCTLNNLFDDDDDDFFSPFIIANVVYGVIIIILMLYIVRLRLYIRQCKVDMKQPLVY